MGPLTAALEFATVLAKIALITIERQPPELQAAYAKAELERLNRWTALLDRLGVFKLGEDQKPPPADKVATGKPGGALP